MELTFLGTSSGSPTKERNVSGIALKSIRSKKWCLIDCGEGTQHQILKTKLSLLQLDAIFITHIHGDHCYGLAGLLASAGMSGRSENLTIIAPKKIFDFIDVVIKTTKLYLPYNLTYIDVDKMDNLDIGDLKVTAIKLSHRVPSFAYHFQSTESIHQLKIEKLKNANIPPAPYWGKIQKEQNICIEGTTHLAVNYLDTEIITKKIIICGDNDDPSLLKSAAIDVDLIVHEATYTHEMLLKIGAAPMHCSAKIIAKFSADIDLKNLILTHFSSRYQSSVSAKHSIIDIQNEAQAHYKGSLFLANDFDCFILQKNSILEKITM